jgi:hypothetical protein
MAYEEKTSGHNWFFIFQVGIMGSHHGYHGYLKAPE